MEPEGIHHKVAVLYGYSALPHDIVTLIHAVQQDAYFVTSIKQFNFGTELFLKQM